MKYMLKKSVKDYVESQQLNNEQLQDLNKLINERDTNTKSKKFLKLKAVAAVMVVSVSLGMFWNFSVNDQVSISQLIAEEVAHNHLKMKPMEVSSRSLSDVRTYFGKLDFSLSQSSLMAASNLQLIGGRYCSIQGETAAQLRMQDQATGEIQIIYQAPYSKQLFRELPNLQEGHEPVRHFVNGIGVDVWVEKGILFARSFSN